MPKKTKPKPKAKPKPKIKYITDPAIKKFLLEHLKHSEVDFSKIKIPDYINSIK